jgi:hypothetical protein
MNRCHFASCTESGLENSESATAFAASPFFMPPFKYLELTSFSGNSKGNRKMMRGNSGGLYMLYAVMSVLTVSLIHLVSAEQASSGLVQ